ncbi:MAG: TonB-dependent receptor plug domain-containing protein, partial [bacterium]
VLVEGINMSDPQTGHHNLDLPVNLEDVERIEIIKGPGARIYSHNAMAGVVNIITREAEDNAAAGHVKYGQHDYYGIGAYGALKTGDLSNHLSLSRASSEGHLKGKTDFDINTLFYRGLIKVEKQRFRIGVGYTDKDFGAYGFYSGDYPNERESTDTLLTYCSAHLQVSGFEIMPKLFWRRHNDDFRIEIKDNWSSNTHRKDTLGTEFNSRFKSGLGTTALGFEIVHEAIESSNLGDHDRQRNGVFLEHSCKPFKRLTIGLGSSAMKYSDRDWEYWPNAGLNVLLADRLNWFVSFARSFRVPTYTELYYNDPANQGNPDLRPEKSLTYETGIRWHREAFHTDFSLFLRDSKDLIDWSRAHSQDPSNPAPWKARNISETKTRGFEVSGYFDPGVYWHNTFVKTLEISYTYLDPDIDMYGLESKYVLDCLKNQIHGSVVVDWSGNLNQTVKARYERRMTGDGHFIVDTRLTYGWSGYEFFLEATNIFDENYNDAGFSPAPGFWMMGGIKFNKDF